MTTSRGGVPDPVDVAVGERIRERRKSLGVSQGALAQGIGVTFQQVQKYERGTNRVSASMLLRVAGVLETSGASLLGEDQGGSAEGEALLAVFKAAKSEKAKQTIIAVAKLIAGLS